MNSVRMKKKFLHHLKLLFLGSFLFCSPLVFSQQEFQYAEYMYNAGAINPAYVGSRGLLSLNMLYRNQWAGFEGAPETLSFSINTPVWSKGVGLGLNFNSDKTGFTSEQNVAADFSYTLRFENDYRLLLGLKGGINMLDLSLSGANIQDPTDENLFDDHWLSPIVGLGVYFHTDNWYVGLASPNILETKHFDELAVSVATQQPWIYLMGGYVFDINPELQFKPALLTKASKGESMAVDLSANFLLKERFALGASYRFGKAFSGMAGFQINDNLNIGYAYDYDTTELGNYAAGSHEIILRFDLSTLQRSVAEKRFF